MTAPNPAAEVRALIEEIRARHVPKPNEWRVFATSPRHVCAYDTRESWPCDAARLADMLEQALTALEFYADESKWQDDGPIGTRLDYGWIAQDTLQRMAVGA